MELYGFSRKDIGNLGESIACEYLKRHGFSIRERNVAYKTGELDIVASASNCLHIIEVKALACSEFPSARASAYDPGQNISTGKIRKLARTAEWHVLRTHWEGEWQVDAVLVWLRRRDGMARVRYLPQIL